MDYTRKQIRTEVRDIISDTGKQLINDNSLNRAIDRVIRKMVELTECNRNVLIVNFPDALTDPTIDYNMLGDETVLTLTDAGGWNLYEVPKCLILEYIDRWILEADGYKVEMDQINTNQLDVAGLLYGDSTVPQEHQPFDVDKFRILPDLQATGYPFKLIIVHRLKESPLNYNPDYPSADGTGVMTTGSGIDDITGNISGYTGTTAALFEVMLYAAGPIDSIKWRKNGGDWSGNTPVTGAAQDMSDGVTFAFAATTGHDLNDIWSIHTDDMAVPTIPERYRLAAVYLTVEEIAPGGKIRDLELAQSYGQMAGPYVDRARRFAGKLTKRKAVKLADRYTPSGMENR